MNTESLIKFHRIDRLYETHKNIINDIVVKTYSTGQVLKGPALEKLEDRIAQMTERKYAVALGSCTDALSLALVTLGLGYGDRIAAPAFTFDASYTCITRVGATRVIVPSEWDFFMMDLERLEAVLKGGVKALVCVNLFGQMMDMARVVELASRFRVLVVEDAAQSFTSSHGVRPAGSFGEISCISFDPTKIVPAFSTGGMAVTDDKEHAQMLRYYSYKNYGCNSQLSSLQAEIILYWLNFIDIWEDMRRKIANKYMVGLVPVSEITLPKVHNDTKHVWHKFVIKAKKRDKLKKYLLEKGIETKVHYAPNKEVLSLPIYPHLYDYEIKRVIKWIKAFYS